MCNYLHRFNLQKISRDREIYEILKWKRKLLISNKKCCQKCNSGNELVAHHLNGWNWYKRKISIRKWRYSL